VPARLRRRLVVGIAAALLLAPTVAIADPVAVATSAGQQCTWEPRPRWSNCASFPDAAGKTVYLMRGVSTKAGAQMIQVYDQAAAPPVGAPLLAVDVPASPAGNYEFKFSPSGITVNAGLLVCNSTNSDPTQYMGGAADTTFEVCFR
jgi:hypothetical protein